MLVVTLVVKMVSGMDVQMAFDWVDWWAEK
jgi:hypothetical protein